MPVKVLVRLLFRLIRTQFLKQLDFSPDTSTTIHILALCVLLQCRYGLDGGCLLLFTTYIDLKETFASVHRKAIWDPLRIRVISTMITGLLTGLYVNFDQLCCKVKEKRIPLFPQ